jgi:hypothetical protein
MKKIIALFVVITTLLPLMVCAQEFPKGILLVQPGSTWQSEYGKRVSIGWLDKNYTGEGSVPHLYADFNISGDVSGLTFGQYLYPTTNKAEIFKDLESWKKFAKKVYDDLVVFPGDIYLEKTPYVFLGNSVIMSHFEMPYHNLVFKRGERLLSIDKDNWKGKPVKVGESYIIGQNGRGEIFFPATQQKDGSYTFSEEMKEYLIREGAQATLKEK